MKLNPEDLVVTSFDTGRTARLAVTTTVEEEFTIGTIIDKPTPNTGCYHCPPETFTGEETVIVP